MREVLPACPPGPTASMTIVSSPSEAAYTAAARPAGPAPTTTTSYTRRGSISSVMPSASANALFCGFCSAVRPSMMTTGKATVPR